MATAETKVAASASTVTVGCKLPHGLVLEVDGATITLNGVNSSVIIGGYGLTDGVDAAFFDAWMAKNKEALVVKNELIFAQAKNSDAQAEAKDKAANKSGFEGMSESDMPQNIKVAKD